MLDIGTLLVVVSLSQPLAARLRLSPLGLCAMIGMRFPRRADVSHVRPWGSCRVAE